MLDAVSERTRNALTVLATTRSAGKPVAFSQAYNLNFRDGWCFALAYAADGYRRGHGSGAFIGLLNYLFETYPLRKVYADVHEFNDGVLKQLRAAGFVEESRLRDHSVVDGVAYDLFRLALYRDVAMELRERWGVRRKGYRST